MELAELRRELIEQHDQMRKLIAEVTALATRVRTKGGGRRAPELRKLLVTLERFLGAHHVAEERVLGPILAKIDAWGAERVALMEEEHRAQHRAVAQALAAAAKARSAQDLARAAVDVALALTAHMEDEERDLLNAELFRDELIPPSQATS